MQNLKQLIGRSPQVDPETSPAPAVTTSQDDLVAALLDIKRLHAVKSQHAQLLSNHQAAEARVQEVEQSLGQFRAAKHPNAAILEKQLAQEQANEKAARIALMELETSSDWKTLCFLMALKELLKDL